MIKIIEKIHEIETIGKNHETEIVIETTQAEVIATSFIKTMHTIDTTAI